MRRVSEPKNPVFLAVQQIFTNCGPEFHREIYENLKQAYGQPHRHYHTLRHITEMLEETKTFELENKRAFLAAVLFHDIVYEPQRSAPGYVGLSNEQESALICERVLLLGGVNPVTILRAKQLIEMTETHAAPEEDDEARLFMDIDMSIVGAPHRRYSEYAGHNAREYLSAFSPEQYYNGRLSFLGKAVEKSPIFKTAHYADREEQAKKNIQWEFAHLAEIVGAAALTNHVAGYKHDYK